MKKRKIIMVHPDGTEDSFSSLTNAAKYIILLGISTKGINTVVTAIQGNASGKSRKAFREYEFKYLF